MSPEQLKVGTGATLERAVGWLPYIAKAMAEYGIATPAQQAMFLAQAGHESLGLLYTREIWGPTPAQVRYEGRRDLGNTQPGDGKRFCGRGIFQVTGRANYIACGHALGMDLIANPELLETRELASRSAGWYWQAHGLNQFADDVDECTHRINGGENGLSLRRALWVRAKKALGINEGTP